MQKFREIPVVRIEAFCVIGPERVWDVQIFFFFLYGMKVLLKIKSSYERNLVYASKWLALWWILATMPVYQSIQWLYDVMYIIHTNSFCIGYPTIKYILKRINCFLHVAPSCWKRLTTTPFCSTRSQRHQTTSNGHHSEMSTSTWRLNYG
jgi:hypothetical protein